ncbi:MAG: histidine kinase [Firmicutes bacterium]|nr:histidine kinase [Bacillota bacterium]
MIMPVVDIINLITASSGLMLALICLSMSVRTRMMDSWGRRFFTIFFSLLFLYVAFDLAELISTDLMGKGNPALSQLFLFLSSMFSSMLMPMIMVLMLHFTGEPLRGNRTFYAVLGVWIVYTVLLIVTQFTDFIYYFTEDNEYHRGPYYPLLLIPPVVIMIIILIALLRRRSQLTGRQFSSFLVYILLPLACMLIQMRFYGVLIIVLGSCLAALFMFAQILTEQAERIARQREENAKLLADNRLLQMRPHFIYNTLMSIYYLCAKDSEKAQQVILDFSSYLRKNFTAISNTGTIPFTEELEHTRAYLVVEEARFEDLLSVRFSTPHVNFRMPALTLQPVVENAVKYGLDPEADPLLIEVKTQGTDKEHVVIVEDNGTGFADGTAGPDADEAGGLTDSLPADAGFHFALDNIRQRLDQVCGGSLDIAPREGGGTVVTIHIPKE